MRRRPIRGQSYGHHRPAFAPVSGRQGTAVLLDDTLGDRESEAAPAAAATEERIEEPRQVFRIESRAAVHNRAFYPSVAIELARSHLYLHRGIDRTVLDGVFDKILKGLDEPLRIAKNSKE